MSEEEKLTDLINQASDILVIQADNPDGDSLGSAIALEQILTGLNKSVTMYCAVNMPNHLKYLTGWSRVVNELPDKFDLSIIVDTSAINLLEKTNQNDLNRIKSKPLIIIDHHQTESTIDFAQLIISRLVVATGEIIYDLSQKLNWPLNREAKDMLAISILSDSLGLMSSTTSAHTIRIIADLVEAGVNLTDIDNLRKETFRKSPELTRYKGLLLTRIENYLDDRLAIIIIPWVEIEKYSPLYNPSVLVIEDMRLIENNAVSIAIKVYNDGHITGKIRTNSNYPIASKLAEHFSGGGHPYASGFKTYDYHIDNLKKEIIDTVAILLKKVDDETI